MTSFPFRLDEKLTHVLATQKFTFSAEVIPPRNGSDQARVLRQIETLIGAGAQFLAVTKGAGGSLRGGSLPIAHAIKDRFSVPCIAHFTCRDLNPFEVENHLVDHHYFGIRNILALRGDPPDGQSDWNPREGGHHFAHQLISQIKNLNRGVYLNRPNGPASDGTEPTDFCIGAAAYPDHTDLGEQLEFFRIKVDAGAEFGITDMLFDPESYARFIDRGAKKGIHIPILPGTRLLRSQKQALRMIKKFKTHVPPEVFSRLPEEDSPDAMSRGVELFQNLADRLKALGAPGVHLYVISDTEGASAALRQLAERTKQGKG